MTYEEIYQAISIEMHDVYDHYEKVVKPSVDRFLKTRERFPARKLVDWQHPKTLNTYHYFVQSNRRSQWNNPFMSVFCEYGGTNGKELLIAIPHPQRRELLLQVFTSHFYKRYGERFMKEKTDYYRNVMQYIMRNSNTLPLGEDCVSLRELQEEIPGYKKESMLTRDGLGLGIRNAHGNIIIYKTFVSFDQLFDSQFKKVWSRYLFFICGLAIESSPKNGIAINEIYEKAAKEIHRIAEDNNLPKEEKSRRIYNTYEQAYYKLDKYII